VPQKRILIVDDEKLVRWALTQKCAEFGYQTVEAENGEEAIRALQGDSVDVVLLATTTSSACPAKLLS